MMDRMFKMKSASFSSQFPIKDYDEIANCFIYKNNTMMDILQIKGKDLQNLDEYSIQMDCLQFIRLYRSYASDLKILSLNFPIDTTEQRNYIQIVKKRTENPVYMESLEEKENELTAIQNNMTDREYYIMIFGKNEEVLIKNRNDIKSILEKNNLISLISKEKKYKILYKLCNPCSRITIHEENKFKETDVGKNCDYNPYLMECIQTRGGINFTNDDRAIKTGDGYVSCLYIHEFPENLSMYWLDAVMNINNVITVLDMETQTNLDEVKKNINRSLGEQNSRWMNSKTPTDKADAEIRYDELKRVYQEIATMHEIIKNVRIRLYITADTYVKLEEKISEIKKSLDGYKCAVGLNEGEYEWKSMFLPYKKQSEFINARTGQPFFSETLAGGHPFNFSSLLDKNGSFYGTSDSTLGAVIWDSFAKTSMRLSYNFVLFGGMGSGKSTFMKKNFKDRAMRGDFIRGFDVSGEWEKLVYSYGGKMIALDGSDGVLNPLEILKTGETEEQSFAQHLGKSTTIYKFLVPDAPASQLYRYENLLRKLYCEHGLIDESGTILHNGKITGLKPTEYPVYSDFIVMMDRLLETDYSDLSDVQQKLKVKELMEISDIREVIYNLVKNYGKMFDGHTTMENIMDEQIVFFNIQGLKNMTERIFDAQIFSALSLCYDNCVKIGTVMKKGYEEWEEDHSKGIKWEDITRFIIYLDEAHRIINANKLTAVDQLVVYEREARKFFGGIGLASQSIRDFIPDDVKSSGVDQIKKLFELSQYKIIMKQDANAVDTLAKIFNQDITRQEVECVPKLETGQCILCISGDKNIKYHNYITAEERNLFSGGA